MTLPPVRGDPNLRKCVLTLTRGAIFEITEVFEDRKRIIVLMMF